MTNYAVLHITKYKQLAAIGRHIDRKYIAPNVERKKIDFNEELTQTLGTSIDPKKTHLREELSGHAQESLPQAVERRIDEGYTQKRVIRKDAVRALGVIMTGSHERMIEIQADEKLFEQWKKANYDFACREFGEENIVRFTLHRDERTPHFHCVFVPITKDGKLLAKSFVDGRGKLRAYQDRYAAAMQPFGLARGVHKELTNRKHTTTREYYREVNQNERKAQKITQEVKKSNLFKLHTVREELNKAITRIETNAMELAKKAKYLDITNKNLLKGAQRIAFQKSLQEENNRAYKWIKHEIPLIDFAISKLGWNLVREKSTKKDVVLQHPEHGKIIAPTRPSDATGHWVYCSLNQQGGGTLIDLLLKEQWSWREIKGLASSYTPVREVINEHTSNTYKPAIEDPKEQEEIASKHLNQISNMNHDTYLNKRGIQTTTYQDFEQLRVTQYKAVFGLYKDFEHEEKGRLCSILNYQFDREGNRRKYFQKDLPRGIAVLEGSEPAKTIVVTESPIDALSYRQIQLNKAKEEIVPTRYISTCGSLAVGIKQELENVFETASKKGQQVVLALDNDKAGIRMTSELTHMLAEKGCSYSVERPALGKDWNECIIQSKAAMNPARQLARLVQQQLDRFETVEHAQSLLHKAGIAERTYQNASEHLKVGDNAVIFGLYKDFDEHGGKRLCSTYTLEVEQAGRLEDRFQKGLPRGLAVLEGSEPAKTIVVTESPMDALVERQKLCEELSEFKNRYLQYREEALKQLDVYKATPTEEHKQAWLEACQSSQEAREVMEKTQQQLEETMFLSTCGSLSEGIKKELAQVFACAKANEQELVLALEEPTASQLKEILEGKDCAYTVKPLQEEAMGLSKIAHDLAIIASANTTGEEEDEDEEDVKKSKQRGRSM